MAVAADRLAGIAAAVLTAAFIWWVLRAPEPFLPLAVLNNPVMRAGCVTTACTRRLHRPTIFVPLYYEMVHGFPPAIRPGAHSHRDDDDAGLVPVRPRHAVHGPLQMGADRDAQHRYRGGRAARGPSADAGVGGGADHRPRRHRHRQLVSRPSPSRSRTRSRISRSASPWAR